MKDNIKSETAITLIVLVITIIVMLILAGVVLSLALGEDNILSRANNAKEQMNYSEAYEELTLKIADIVTERLGNATLKDIAEYLGKDKEYQCKFENGDVITSITEWPENVKEIYVIYKGYEFKIDNDLNITKIGKNADNENDETNDNNDIVSDGLVLHLDGINNARNTHNATTDQWADLAKEDRYAKMEEGGTVSWTNNALVLDGSTCYTIESPVDDSYGTAEVCLSLDDSCVLVDTNSWFLSSCIFGCELDGIHRDWGILINSSGNFAFGYRDHDMFSSEVYALDGAVHTVTYTYQKNNLVFYIDGTFIGKIDYENENGNVIKEFGIGWNNSSTNTAISGEIYSIKFYNRDLTGEEVVQNHQSNIKRFSRTALGKSNYVQDSLEMQLSKEAHSAIQEAVSWTEDALVLDGSNYYTVKNPINDFRGTVEVCLSIDEYFKPVETNNWYLASCVFGCELPGAQKDWGILIDQNGNFAFGYSFSTIHSSNVSALDGKIHTISFTFLPDRLIYSIDGQKSETIKVSLTGDLCSQFGIGWNNSSNETTIKGNIYNIRFYNNNLSTEKRLINYNCDQKRYAQ